MLQDIRIRQRDFLIELARILTQELDLDVLLWQILRISLELLNGEAGFIALLSPNDSWRVKSLMGITEPTAKYIETYLTNFPEGNESVGKDALIEIDMLIRRICDNPELNFADGVGLPLIEHGNILGIIVIFRNIPTGFSINDRAMLKIFADQAAIAVRNAFLYGENIREKDRLNAVINSAADGLLVLDVIHRIERANPAALKILHMEKKSVVGSPHDEIIDFEKIDSGMELTDAEAGGWPFSANSILYVEGDLKFSGAEGKTIPVGITYAPVMNAEQGLVNIIAQIRDISKFREADELKNTFISTISHELKTPVALIEGYASTMRREDGDWNKDVLLESLSVIEDEADRLTGLINDLLDASRLYAGTLTMNKSELDLLQLCKKTAEMMQSQTCKHQIKVDFPVGFPLIYGGDGDRIQQVLINLISNAIKYSAGGSITLVGSVEDPFIRICVLDEGNGLQPDEIPHLFERFFRSKKTANSAKGVGLGLFLSNGIC